MYAIRQPTWENYTKQLRNIHGTFNNSPHFLDVDHVIVFPHFSSSMLNDAERCVQETI